ncbi:MAG: oligosaccharide flippase family protein [candidate division KSB1 bacterium]|nr:oligosaccharide flippase family protein [candidate division KSB1 bacterium]
MNKSESNVDLNNRLKNTLKSSFVYIPSKLIPGILGLLLIRFLTAYFSQEEYGYYQIGLSTFGFIQVFSVMWLSSSVSRFYIAYKNRNKLDIFLSTLVITSFVGIVIVTLFSFVLNVLVFKSKLSLQLFGILNMVIIASFASSFFMIFIQVYRASFRAKLYSILWSLFSLGKFIVSVILVLYWGVKAEAVFIAFSVVSLFVFGFITFNLNLKSVLKFKAVSFNLMKEFIKYGLPFSLSFLSFWVLSLSDRYLIGILADASQVGLYSVGYTISENTLKFVYMILMLAAYPLIIDSWEKNGNFRTQQLITGQTRFFFLICSPLLTILVSIPKHILLIFSDRSFIEGSTVLPMIALGIFLFGLSQYLIKGFELQKQSYKITLVALIGSITNVSLNFILIPKLGYFGAAISALIAYVCYFIAVYLLSRPILEWIPPVKSIVKVAAASIIFGIFLNISSSFFSNLIVVVFLLIPSGIILYMAVLFDLERIAVL